MSSADRSLYAEEVTRFSEGELIAVLSVAEPPICLLGGWAVHVHVTNGFRSEHDRAYIGSRDIDLGIHVDPGWSADELATSPAATTMRRIEADLGYRRGRFGFYRQFHRETGNRLDDEAAREEPPHNVFRLDIDIMPDTTELDAFEETFGFRPPSEPLLEPVFANDAGETLASLVGWDVPNETRIAPAAVLGAMKVRAIPQRDDTHKLLKDLADLYALLWYVADYDEMKTAVRERITNEDLANLGSVTSDDLYDRTARLIEVAPATVRQAVDGVAE